MFLYTRVCLVATCFGLKLCGNKYTRKNPKFVQTFYNMVNMSKNIEHFCSFWGHFGFLDTFLKHNKHLCNYICYEVDFMGVKIVA